MKTSILLADDHGMVREALRRVIESRDDLEVVAEARDGHEAVELARRYAPDVASIDLSMPGLSGVETIRQIAGSCPATNLLALSMYEDWGHVRAAFDAGVHGYVVKSAAMRELLEAIYAVGADHGFLSPAVAQHVIDAGGPLEPRPSPLARLTEREREVLVLIAEGLSSREIANRLGHAPKTAESHRSRLMRKLGVHKTSALVRIAIRDGLVVP